jgi:hypothetical protein
MEISIKRRVSTEFMNDEKKLSQQTPGELEIIEDEDGSIKDDESL